MQNNIKVFQDTLNRIQSDSKLIQATKAMLLSTKVYPENFQSSQEPNYPDMTVRVDTSLTLQAAKVFRDNRTAVLNFANPIEPGGAVLGGANAQEEYLCRASNLYSSLISNIASEYFEYHSNSMKKNPSVNILSSDMLIYSKNVTVFKEDKGYDAKKKQFNVTQVYTADWYTLDVITCAAPYIGDIAQINGDALKFLFIKRIKNILEAAIDNHIETLILGAFGCGAFNNPPEIVATAFKEVFAMPRYQNSFSNVVFAIKANTETCKNVETFNRVLGHNNRV